jgi:hypothetical protein
MPESKNDELTLQLRTPAIDKLIQDARRDEERFCSLLLKSEECLKRTVEAGVQPDWFWTPDCEALFAFIMNYWKAHESRVTPPHYDTVIRNTNEPAEATRKTVYLRQVYAQFVQDDDFAHLLGTLKSRHVQRQTTTILDRYYRPIMMADINQIQIIENFRQDVAGITVPNNGARHVRTGADFGRMEFAETRWIVPGIQPVGVTVLAGKPKSGKSWSVLQVSTAVATGGSVFGEYDEQNWRWKGGLEVEKGEVLLLALEDTDARVQFRLRALVGADGMDKLSGLHIVTKTDKDWHVRFDQQGLDQLSAFHKAHPGLRLIVADTLQKVKPPRDRNKNAYEGDYDSLHPVMQWAAQHDVSILFVTHSRKAKADDVFDSITGSAGISGSVDTMMVLQRKRGDNEAVLTVTGRDVDDARLRLLFERDKFWQVIGEYEETPSSDKDNNMSEIQMAIDRLGGSGSTREITEAVAGNVNLSESRIRWYLTEMSRIGKIERTERGRYEIVKPLLEGA